MGPNVSGTFAFRELSAALVLERALGDVVHGAVAGDVAEGVRGADVLSLGADYDAELHFPIGFLRAARKTNGIIRSAQRRGGLQEQNGFLGRRVPGFGGVGGVIQTDADDFGDLANARAESRRAGNERQRRGIEFAQLGKARGRECFSAEIGDLAGEVVNLAGCVKQAGFFPAGISVAHEFHGSVRSRVPLRGCGTG